MGKDVKCGPGEAVWSILLVLFHVPWPGASQGNCSTTTGSVANEDSRAPQIYQAGTSGGQSQEFLFFTSLPFLRPQECMMKSTL